MTGVRQQEQNRQVYSVEGVEARFVIALFAGEFVEGAS
jgi:hypothetical protein